MFKVEAQIEGKDFTSLPTLLLVDIEDNKLVKKNPVPLFPAIEFSLWLPKGDYDLSEIHPYSNTKLNLIFNGD